MVLNVGEEDVSVLVCECHTDGVSVVVFRTFRDADAFCRAWRRVSRVCSDVFAPFCALVLCGSFLGVCVPFVHCIGS